MTEQGTPPIPTRPLFAGHLMAEEERVRKFREFVRMVIENCERAGNPLPKDHPLREWLPISDAA